MDGEYILPRVKLSNNGVHNMSVIDIDGPEPEKNNAADIVKQARRCFDSGRTRPYAFREKQLKNFVRFLEENEKQLCQVIYADLKKSDHESIIFEIEFTIKECRSMLKNLKKWMKPVNAEKPMMHAFDKCYIVNDPYGVVLVMGAWNYPLHLTLAPAVGAIAAGNCVVIKPSDLSPSTSQFIYDKLPEYLDRDCYPVFLGGVAETTSLLEERFDYIFFTGSPLVGKIIHKAANKYLTPTTLELGGKSPAYIDSTADIEIATRRILWGKFTNCGQTCIAPDYVLCSKNVQEKFLQEAKKLLKELFGSNIKASPDYGRMISERHFIRVCNLIKNQNIALGGNFDAQELFIHPTIVVDVNPDDEIMQEEIFGPVLPIVNVSDVTEAVDFINGREKPLALYVFTKDQRTREMFLEQTSSGGVCINDTLMHITVDSLPFGGVGNSGMGNYHGKKSFDVFVHKKSVLQRNFNGVVEKMQGARYPPYSKNDTAMLKTLMKYGGESVSFKFVRYLIAFGLGVGVTIGGYYLKKYCDEN